MVDTYSREGASRQKPWPGIGPVAQKLWPEQPGDLGPHAVARRLADTRADDRHGTAQAFLSRFIVLQAIGAAGIVGLWVVGIAGKPFAGSNAFLCWLITAIGALGIVCVFFRRWRDVDWLATHVVRIGLLGTVVGLIVAFSAARAGGSADPNAIRSMIASVIDGMYVALYATLLGITTNLWLKINLRLLGNVDG
jgi:hypothetical protein